MNQIYLLRDISKIIGVSHNTLSKAGKSGIFSSKLQNLLVSNGFNPGEIIKSVNQVSTFRGQTIKIKLSSVGWNVGVNKVKTFSNQSGEIMVGANGLEPLTSVLS